MSSAAALVGIALRLLGLGLAVAFTVETSKGDSVLLKIGKFLGLVMSVVPLVGLIFYLAARGRPSHYGERCGGMALFGIALYGATRAL